MSTKYKNSKDVPTYVLAARLFDLADFIAGGGATHNEFNMRDPAEADRDADLVLSEAALRLLLCEPEAAQTSSFSRELDELSSEVEKLGESISNLERLVFGSLNKPCDCIAGGCGAH